MRRLLCIFILLLPSSVLFAQNKDTVTLYFELNEKVLNKHSQQKIDSLVYNDILYPGEHIMIIGYADYLGSGRYNEELSQERAKNVQAYLQQYGISKENITLCIGKGEIERPNIKGNEGYAADRKVDIVIGKKQRSTSTKQKIVQTVPKSDSKAAAPQKHTGDLIDIASYKPGETFVLRNIYFPAESHDISGSRKTLDKLYNILLSHPTLKISIEGHVCCINGYPDAYDIDSRDNNLSLNRAKAIYDYLVDRGIDADRLKYYGFGKSKPIVAVERTEDDAERNRRVEIRILEK
ncbi:MAG: OmpA family protein [Bacteroidetes bacterium]|nr:OmpA family protein [Bacteroidota bacterium]